MAEFNSRPSSPLLPTFGIRDLNEPPASLGLIQITAGQYDGTIKSQPDATLTYVDLDDGEIITVGNAFELGQRLDEPVSSTTHKGRSHAPFRPPLKNTSDENQKKMHIFDIRNTSGNLAVWRDLEAYSSKALRKRDLSPSSATRSHCPPTAASPPSDLQSSANTATSQSSLNQDDLSAALSKLSIACKPATPETRSDVSTSEASTTASAHAEPPASLEMTLNDVFTGIQCHLGPLADFLESTANQLRSFAEKTRGTDTTPVENILNGFKNIVTEVGELGIGFLANLDAELDKNRSTETVRVPTQTSPTDIQSVPAAPVSKLEQSKSDTKLPLDASAAKKVCFVEKPLSELKSPAVVSQPQLAFPPPPTFGVPSTRVPLAIGSAPGLPTSTKPSLMSTFLLPSTKSSIIDSEPVDSDVLTRYPPLPSLRRAASATGLHNESQPSTIKPGLSTTSALTRYPSIGQFEEQTRLVSKSKCQDSAAVVYTQVPPKLWKPSQQQSKKADIYKKPMVEDVADEAVSAPVATSTTAAPPVKAISKEPNDVAAKVLPTIRKRPASYYPSSLPGAWPESKPWPESEPWPESKPDDWSATVPNSTASVMKPTAAPFQPRPFNLEQPLSDISSRISSPVSETYTRGPVLPKKSQTISGTNPAARLNGPFDPLAHIPVLQPRPQRSQPDLPASKSVSRSIYDVPSAALPRRSHTVHLTDRYKPRDPAPYPYPKPNVWETYAKNNHSLNALPTTSYSTQPWSFYPETSKPSSGPAIRPTAPPAAPRPKPSVVRPVQSMSGLRSQARNDLQAFTAKPLPAVPAPHHFPPLQNQTSRTPSTAINPATLASPVSAFPSFTWTQPRNDLRRSSSVLSPAPTPITRPRGRSGASPPAPLSSKSVDECIKQLKVMGFGSDPNEFRRLNVYAGAAAGDLEAAIEMIEEDREAAKELELSSQTSQVGSLRDVERDFDTEENPWED